MTDSSDPKAPKSSRRRPKREPATIDLKANEVDDNARAEDYARAEGVQENVQEDTKPEETIAAGAEPPAEGTAASPEATLDSGMGTDSIGPETPSQETLAQEPPLRDGPPPDEASRPAPARRTSTAALLGTGVLGGLVGAGLVYGVQTWMTPDPQDDQRLAQLEQRVSALGQPSSAPQGDFQAVEERILALEAARSSLDQQLQAIQGTAEQAATRAEEAMNRPLPEAPAPENGQALDEIRSRLSSLEAQVQSNAQEIAGAASSAQNAANAVQALDGRFSDLESRLSEQENRLSNLDNRLSQQESGLSQQQTGLNEQEQRLADLSNQVTERNQGAQSTTQAGIRVILAERLGEALTNGNPYPDVLEGLRRFEADPDRLASLEPFAQSGAPTAAELAQSFEPLGAAILRDERAASGEWSDRLLRMMDRVVTVRPVNEPGSTGVSSLVARIEQALERGDVADAAAAWESLPEPARRQSEDWGRQVQAVAQARQASQAVADNALAALNQTAQ